jgi:hypothetical protein
MVRKWSTGPISLSYTTPGSGVGTHSARLTGELGLSLPEVRLCRYRLSLTGDLGFRGVRGAVGLGYRFTVSADPAIRVLDDST